MDCGTHISADVYEGGGRREGMKYHHLTLPLRRDPGENSLDEIVFFLLPGFVTGTLRFS